jgi:AbrB family looped-hinge helix DNA binding protein
MTTIATVSSKGQITIPASFREMLGIKKNDKVSLSIEDGTVVISKQPDFDKMVEKWTRNIPKGVKPLTDASAFYNTRKPRI